MNTVVNEGRYGYGFVPEGPSGEDEYAIRNLQLEELYSGGAKRQDGYRHLDEDEIRALLANRNRCAAWEDVLVREGFDPGLVYDCFFAGLVRIGELRGGTLRYHDYHVPVGLSFSRIISCDIGDSPAIHHCHYLSHYIIGDHVILSSIGEMDTTNHSKFGEGIVKDGEDEEVRVWIDPLNETGGRGILPFAGMICADAYLWTVYRDDRELMAAFKRITQDSADSRRGYYGVVGHDAVIKHCRIIKDVKVGNAVYIKGANKLKNITIKSDAQDPTQIGEGVELVNGIVGYGCRVFYEAKAVRFILGNNCNLKYGARLIHSVLGDNSTVSCCEVLNNLVFPAHEQHHNNSFLIASMIMGQSNMAAGATVGSNHNSRGNDGEIIAGRGFWPGLSSTLKHNCRFASFVLIAKGSYPGELHIPLPFSLVTHNTVNSRREVMPAYWWLYNLYALERNSRKTRDRDKRIFRVQRIETDYLAPDTAGEIMRAMALLEEWAGRAAEPDREDPEELRDRGRTALAGDSPLVILVENRVLERSRRAVRIRKPRRGYRAYREMLCYYGVRTLAEYLNATDSGGFLRFQAAHPEEQSWAWVNLGGQLVPEAKAAVLMEAVRRGRLRSWEAVHEEYENFYRAYPLDRALNALQVLRFLGDESGGTGGTRPISRDEWNRFIDEAVALRRYIDEQVYVTKLKDFTDPFRSITYRNRAEQEAVLGKIEDNPFIQNTRQATQRFIALAEGEKVR
jgi:NDP-sugar pyrophosphorylase family protein